MCSREDFSAFVKAMKSIYTMSTFLPDLESIETWYRALQHFSYEDLKRTFTAYYVINSYPPTPADLIQGIVKAPTKTGYDAWSDVLLASQKHNTSDLVEEQKASACLDDLAKETLRRIGGWKMIRNCPTWELDRLMKQFVTAYDVSVQQETIAMLPETMRHTLLGYEDEYLIEGDPDAEYFD